MKPLNSLKIHFNLHRLGGLTKSQNKLELIPFFDLKCNFSPKFRITFLLPSLATLLSILKLTKKYWKYCQVLQAF